jgi:hypothetical protein
MRPTTNALDRRSEIRYDSFEGKGFTLVMKTTKKKWIKPAMKDVPIFFECTCYAGAI